METISPYMRADKYGIDGFYTVMSLYFESPDFQIYYETKNKLKFRQKLRLRTYDDTDLNGNAFFEIKQKHKKVVNKRRMVLPLAEAYRYLANSVEENIESYETSNHQVFKEINHFQHLYNLHPEMIISYDRKALHGINNSDLRLTFDFNLRCRDEDLFLENGSYGELFIDQNLIVLEVKVTDSVPLWLSRILQQLECEQRSASKYCTSLEHLRVETVSQRMLKENVLIGGGI